jgi:5-methyltetrahydrofolate--homocysteine methyltransferase
MNPLIQKIQDVVIAGEVASVVGAVQAALDAGLGPETLLNEGLIQAMGEVGRQFECGDLFVPEMLLAARTMQKALDILKPLLQGADVKPAGYVVIGTVKGDLHDIGKNLVSIMLKGAGFELQDLGTDVPAERFVAAVRDTGASVVALSALLTTTMINMRTVIDALAAAGLRDTVKVVVGGAPITDDFARQIGADGFAADASKAVGLIRALVA